MAGLSVRSEGDVPGQEFFDTADRMVGELAQDCTEIKFRVEPVELSRSVYLTPSRSFKSDSKADGLWELGHWTQAASELL
jgi:hypothetical protein